jgi:hypothetical protein
MSKTKTFSEQIRECVRQSGKSCYRISMDTGIDRAVLSRFMNNKGWMAEGTINILTKYIGMAATLTSTTGTCTGGKSRGNREDQGG